MPQTPKPKHKPFAARVCLPHAKKSTVGNKRYTPCLNQRKLNYYS